MSQVEALASHWVLLFFLCLLNKYMLAWSIDYGSIERSSTQQNYIHRTWSEWTLWSACSRTCGGGVKMRTRVCKIGRIYGNSATPNTCVGETVEYELCSLHNCSPHDKEFLEYQCSLRDGQSLAGRKIEEWIPYRYGKNPCELQCWSRDRTLVHSFGKAIDGTKCAVTANLMLPALCINGRCTPVDCAGQIGHDNKLDRCGVCRGDNSTCIHYQDTFRRRPRIRIPADGYKEYHYDYERIATIPAGATEIIVEEDSENNFLALMDHKGAYAVNGNWRIQSPGRSVLHGSEFLYNRTWNGEESLSTPGPTRFDLHVYVLGSGDIPTVRYEYWISANNPFKSSHRFQTLNQIKHTDADEKKAKDLKRRQPENNHIHDESPIRKQGSPAAKFQGYKSYYHRNEILKSVPSWSIKRHRTHKNNISRHFPDQNDITFSFKKDNEANAIFFNVNNQKRSPSSGGGKETDLKDRILDENKNVIHSRTYNNSSTTIRQPVNRSYTVTDKIDNFQNSTTVTLMNNRESYDLSMRNSNTVTPLSKRKFENLQRSVVDYGRPTTTLALTRSVNYHREYSVTLQPKSKKDVDSDEKYKTENRRHRSSGKQKRQKRRKSENGDCPPCSKPKHMKKSFCTSEFVLRASVMSIEKQEGSYRYELQVSQSYKNQVPISSREFVWTADSCRCPKLRAEKEYIIMGYSGTSSSKRESRLLVNRHSFTRKYSQRRARTMQRLLRNQNKMCKEFQ